MDAFGGWSKDLNGAVPIGGGPKKDAEIPFVSKPERWTHFGDSDSLVSLQFLYLDPLSILIQHIFLAIKLVQGVLFFLIN